NVLRIEITRQAIVTGDAFQNVHVTHLPVGWANAATTVGRTPRRWNLRIVDASEHLPLSKIAPVIVFILARETFEIVRVVRLGSGVLIGAHQRIVQPSQSMRAWQVGVGVIGTIRIGVAIAEETGSRALLGSYLGIEPGHRIASRM